MEIVICPDNCYHVPFPHRLLITSSERIEKGHTVIDRRQFIICTNCGHWIGANHIECLCTVSCHSESRNGLREWFDNMDPEGA